MKLRTRGFSPARLYLGGLFVGLLAIIFYASPLKMEGAPPLLPWLSALVVFLWATRLRSFFVPLMAFVLGLVMDQLTGGPLGVWAGAHVAAALVASMGGRVARGNGLLQHVFVFAGVMAAMVIAAWLGASLGAQRTVDFLKPLTEATITLIVFVPVWYALAWLKLMPNVIDPEAP